MARTIKVALVALVFIGSVAAFIIAYNAVPKQTLSEQQTEQTEQETTDWDALIEQIEPRKNTTTTTITPPPTPTPTQTTPQPTTNDYSLAAIATHNSKESCYLIIHDNVYDVTTFISKHPGGKTAILRYCGKDATQAFERQGHSQRARNLLNGYYLAAVSA